MPPTRPQYPDRGSEDKSTTPWHLSILVTMTPATLLLDLSEALTPRYGQGEAASVARIVAEDVFSLKKEPQRRLSKEEMLHVGQLRTRLLAGEPVQYVLGQADFFGLKYRVSPAVLIPRQETEELVAWVLEHLRHQQEAQPKVLDVGLGSGCIGLTLALHFPRMRLYGWEKSGAALEVARENARRLLGPAAAACQLEEADVLDAARWEALPALDVLVSNPPYIARHEQSLMPEHVWAHEPDMALFVEGADPLLFYHTLARLGERRLRTGGAIFLECNEFNASQVADLLRQRGWQEVTLRQDLAGADRMVGATWSGW